MAKIASLKKPIDSKTVLDFAEGPQSEKNTPANGAGASRAENSSKGRKSGLLPAGDVRLTANIREDLHLKLKLMAARERTTIGELIEKWIESA